MLDNAVFHAKALHVLAADVEDELDSGKHLLGTAQMGDGLDLARVDVQGLQEQMLAVAGDGDMAELDAIGAVGILGQQLVKLGNGAFGTTKNVTLVVGVAGPKQGAIFTDKRRLEGCGTGIDSKVGHALVIFEIAAHDLLKVVPRLEFLVVVGIDEQGRQTHNLGTLHVAEILQTLNDLAQKLGLGAVRRAGNGAAAGNEKMRVFRDDDVLFVELERLVKALAQLRKILQGTAEEGHVAANRPAAGKAGNGLRDDGLEDRGGNVLLAGALVQKGLDIGFGENAAARCDGMQNGMAFGQFVQARRIGIEQACHLVDEGSGTAGAGAVHTLLNTFVEVNDLGILAAKLDGNVGFGDEGLDGGFGSDDLLDEGQIKPLRQQKAAGAGNRDRYLGLREVIGRFFQDLKHRGAHVGMMTAVHRVEDLVTLVDHRNLDGSRADIDAQTQNLVGICNGFADSIH